MNKFWFFLYALLGILKLPAQLDTSFWFVAPSVPVSYGNSPIGFNFLTYNQAVTMTLSMPANTLAFTTTVISIPASTNYSFDLVPYLSAVQSSTADIVEPRGFHIRSSSKISAYYYINHPLNRETISLKGTRALGSDFYVSLPTTIATATNGTGAGARIDIVASEDNTTILLTPRDNIVGHSKNTTFARSLQKGETFTMLDTFAIKTGALSPKISTLAGSIVSADKPVGVTISSSALSSGSCTSMMADQITTSSNLGKYYVIPKTTAGTEVAYILSPVNGTGLSITNASSTINWLINTGETYTVNLTDPLTYIQTTNPVYVTHIGGFGCKLSGAQVTPAYCAGSYSTAFTRTTADTLSLLLYTRNGFQNTFTLTSGGTNVPVSPASFSVVPGTSGNLVAARLSFSTSSIPVGSYNYIANSKDVFGLGIINGSGSAGSGYAYATEFGTSPFVYANPVPTATICSNTTFSLNGFIGGGPITGFWSTNAFGVLTNSTSLNTAVFTPSPLDTTPSLNPVKIWLTSTGICPSASDTLRLTVRRAPRVNAGVDISKCGNNAVFTLNGSVDGATTNQGIWTTTGTGTFNPNASALTVTYAPSSADTSGAGVIYMILTSTNNGICLAEKDSLKVTFNKPPLVDAGPVSTTVCANNAAVNLVGTVSGTTTSTGKWSTSGSGFFNPNNLSLIATYVPSNADISAGSVYVKLSSTNNQLYNCNVVEDSIKIVFTQPATINAGVDLNSCKNKAAVSLQASIGGTTAAGPLWSGSGAFTPTNTALTVTYVPTAAEISAGFALVNVTTINNGNCVAVSDQVRIDFRDKPNANFLNTAVCLNGVTSFTDISTNFAPNSSINGWQWNFGDASPTSTVQNATHSYTAYGTYTAQLVVKNSYNCYDTARKNVTVFPLPDAKFGITRVCTGNTLRINFWDSSTVAAPATLTSFFWDFGGQGLSTHKDTAYVFPSPGLYTIKHIVYSNSGCSDTILKVVNITPRPKAGFYFSNINQGYTINANISFVDSSKYANSWSWDFGNGLISNIQNPSTIYNANGTYTVTQIVKDALGCADTLRKLVRIANIAGEIKKLIPNIVTPNGDGKNDIWRLDFIDVFFPNAHIEIFNRWGEKIFESDGYKNAWDGSYKGNPLPVGAYLFTIDLKNPSEPDIIKGTITLVK
ncbi:MAG: PKD domain-containing protein [Sediminibacterium sp.]|nr:PKD domain-containing protein [Sediminibacterium sp.]